MRTVRIDFTNQSVSYPDGTLAGRRGEHLMTQLIISLPEEMGASEIEYYRLAFCRYGNEERILTNRITEATEGDRAYRSGNLIYCKLWHDLTDAQGLFFNVEGCREKNGEEVRFANRPGLALASNLPFPGRNPPLTHRSLPRGTASHPTLGQTATGFSAPRIPAFPPLAKRGSRVKQVRRAHPASPASRPISTAPRSTG